MKTRAQTTRAALRRLHVDEHTKVASLTQASTSTPPPRLRVRVHDIETCSCGACRAVRERAILRTLNKCVQCRRRETAAGNRTCSRCRKKRQHHYRTHERRTPRIWVLKMRADARRRSIECTLDDAHIESLMRSACWYCKAPPVDDFFNGIDRVNNANGYVHGNVVPCCTWCNFAKRTTSSLDFIRQCRRVSQRHVAVFQSHEAPF